MLTRSDATHDGLEALDYAIDIGSREQISRDYAARIRMAYLVAQNGALLRQTQFADTKASALLALIGLIGTRMAVDAQGAPLHPALIALFAIKGIVLAFCLLELTPRYPSPREQSRQAQAERFSWVSLTAPGASPASYAEFARTAEVSQLVVSTAHANAVVAAVLARKFRYLRFAFLLAIADVAGTLLYYTGGGRMIVAALASG